MSFVTMYRIVAVVGCRTGTQDIPGGAPGTVEG
jgi:hypothetical protein